MREQQSPAEYAVLAEASMSNVAAAVREFDEPTQFSSWPIREPSDSDFGRGREHAHYAVDAPEVTRGWDNAGPEEFGINRIASETEPTWAPELKDRRRVDVLDDGQGFRVWFIAGALIAAFSVGWVGGANSDRFLSLGTDTSPRAHLPSASPGMVGSETQTVHAKSDRGASSVSAKEGPAGPVARKVATIAINASEDRPSAGGGRLNAASPTSVSPPTKESVPGPAAARSEAQNLARLTPAPETRPATIAGWTVRDVHGGVVTLEGPGGVWKAMTGDTVPGVGRVHSIVRWGSHWIVATSKGLIATR